MPLRGERPAVARQRALAPGKLIAELAPGGVLSGRVYKDFARSESLDRKQQVVQTVTPAHNLPIWFRVQIGYQLGLGGSGEYNDGRLVRQTGGNALS